MGACDRGRTVRHFRTSTMSKESDPYRRLVNEGHDVIALDNFFTSQKTNVKDLLDKPNFEVVRHDVTKEFFIEVDQIYNMACPASPVHYQYNPVKTMKTSVCLHMSTPVLISVS